MADSYRAQTNPGGSSPLGAAKPEAFGAGIGSGLEDAGNAISRMGDRRKALNRDQEAASAGLAFANAQSELDKISIDARNNAAPGAAGHSEAIDKFTDERISAELGKIKDPRIRASFAEQYARLRGNVTTREYGWEAAARTEKLVGDAGQTTRTLSNGVANNPDPGGFDVGRGVISAMWRNMDVAADVKEKGEREDLRTHALAFGQAMADREPGAFLGDGKNGGILKLISPDLTAEDIDRLRTRGESERDRLEAKARRDAAVQEARQRDEIQTGLKRINTLADYSVTDQELDSWASAAQTFGDKSLALDVANARDLRDTAKATRDWAPGDWKDAIGTLEAKGDKLTPAEAMRLTHLRQLRTPAESKFNERPDEWANAAGDPMPAIDWTNPTAEQGQARATWSKRIEGVGGKPALLNSQEVQQFKELLGPGDVAGELKVAQAVRGVFGAGRDGVKALEQIDKGNAKLKLMLGLPARTAADYGLGVGALKRNGKLLNADVAREEFDGYARGIPQEIRDAVFDAATAIAAADLDRNGGGEPSEDSFKQAFDRAVHRATGATGTAGGMITWGEQPLWIPPDMPKAEALKRLSRATPVDIINANVGPDGTGPGGAPYYMGPDGKRVRFGDRVADLLKRGTLEPIAPGVFRVLLEDGGHVVNAHGDFWQFDIRKLGSSSSSISPENLSRYNYSRH